MHKRGTLIEFSSYGSSYTGFVIGTCSYDNNGPDNAYVVRYVWTDGDAPRKPYTIVAADSAKPMKDYPEDFLVGSHWSCTPRDRCVEWVLQRDEETNNLLIVAI